MFHREIATHPRTAPSEIEHVAVRIAAHSERGGRMRHVQQSEQSPRKREHQDSQHARGEWFRHPSAEEQREVTPQHRV
jgi:hypothetical protein